MPTCRCFVFLLCLPLFLFGCATQAPVAVHEPRIVYTTQLQALLAGVPKPVLLDARLRAEFDEAHLAGALNFPAREPASRLAELPRDLKTPLVVYANGVQDKAGLVLVTRLMAAGCSDVSLYAEGLSGRKGACPWSPGRVMAG